MTFKVLIIEDNHSFIDTLKVMLRDLPLDFSHAYRYNDALAILEKEGVFFNRQETVPAAPETAEPPAKKRGLAGPAALYNDGGVFLLIVEQNTETSMKGTDFVAHAVRRFPGLSESDFILLTHRIDSVPARNFGFPVFEKPLRAPQIRQAVLQKIRQAQEIAEAQARAASQPKEGTTAEPKSSTARKGLRDLLKIHRSAETTSESEPQEQKPKKTRRARPAANKKTGTQRVKPK